MEEDRRNLQRKGYSQNERLATDHLYQIAIETRNFEIGQLSARNNFFMLFQGVLIAGLLQSSSGSPPPFLIFTVSICGLAISIMQAAMASGAKFWQATWEYHLCETEKRLQHLVSVADSRRKFVPLFSCDIDETKATIRSNFRKKREWISLALVHRFSVSKIPIYTGISFAVFWGAISLFCIRGNFTWLHQQLSWP